MNTKQNWKNQTIWTGDNLEVMRGLNSNSVDLIYLDPPFNSNADYEALPNTKAAGAKFKDTWRWTDIDTVYLERIREENDNAWFFLQNARLNHSRELASYLIVMLPRVKEMHRILKPTGSIYLHCDPTASHYLKGMMDMVFGKANFRNEIVWHYSAGHAPKGDFKRKHDCILRYSLNEKSKFNQPRMDYFFRSQKDKDAMFKFVDEDGRLYRKNGVKDKYGNDKRFYWDKGTPCDDVWSYLREKSINSLTGTNSEKVGYPTQKPLALLRRIIEASTNPGDVVLDPFCGCATACVAAEELGREWLGIDISPMAAKLVTQRIRGFESDLFRNWKCINRTGLAHRTDLGDLPKPQTHKEHLFGVQKGKCGLCIGEFKFRHLEVDHIVPRAKGGTDHLSNLQLLCGSCNRKKGTRTQEEARAVLKKLGWID